MVPESYLIGSEMQAAKDEEDVSPRDKAASPEPEMKYHFILLFRYVATCSLSHRTEHTVTQTILHYVIITELSFQKYSSCLSQRVWHSTGYYDRC